MVAFTCEKEGSNTLLQYSIQQEDVLDIIVMDMLSKNTLPALVPFIYSQKGKDRLLKYDITSKESLESCLSGKVNRKKFLDVLSALTEALLCTREHMVDTGMLILDMDYVFINARDKRAEFICLPVLNKGKKHIFLEDFFKNLIVNIAYEDKEDCKYLASVINLLNEGHNFSLKDFKRLVEELRLEVVQIEKHVLRGNLPVVEEESREVNNIETAQSGIESGITEPLGIGAGFSEYPYLLRLKGGEKIYVNKPVFRIGKEKSYVDYFIGYNSAISRSHADIITRYGEYFLVDNESTNFSYVNDAMVKSYVEVNISHGSRIRLANEEFEFRLY